MNSPAAKDPPRGGRRRRLAELVRTQLTWGHLFRVTSYLRSALWVVPLVAIVLDFLTVPVLHRVDAWLGWRLAGWEPEGATALYETVVTLTLSFLVFTFGSLLVAIQVASGQLTPRIIATTLLRNNVVRYSVGLFVFTLIFAVGALNRHGFAVHQMAALFTALLGVACIVVFLFLIDYAARLLRPVSIVAQVGADGLTVIESVYPNFATRAEGTAAAARVRSEGPERIVTHEGFSGSVLAVDLKTLVYLARRHDGLIEFVPRVGDFVASGEPLFALRDGAVRIDERTLRTTVALGSERTLEQDPIFAFRILVDIALKALSPAINDPTTAVLALDQVHRLLRSVGRRDLRDEIIADEAGRPRVLFRTPDWDDFVHIACQEVRNCGSGNIQIARRLRAMLLSLLEALPVHRHAALKAELARLDRTIETLYPLPEDLLLARVPDSQGLGGAGGEDAAARPGAV